MSSFETGQMAAVETGQMSAAETGQMSAVETGQMSAAETGPMSVVETRQMSTIATGLCPVLTPYISFVPGRGMIARQPQMMQMSAVETGQESGRCLLFRKALACPVRAVPLR